MQIGAKLGPYEVVAKLGEGGMGEVYCARDTRLGRDVALKILPDIFATNPDRLMRFQREAKTLASLNHPHIAQIYGIVDSVGAAGAAAESPHALVMELVDGEDLAQRIARGPIGGEEAIAIAHQIIAALEAAHDAGIIHRDLKPANVKLRTDGTVKVLDFGLAKTDPMLSSSGSRAVASVTSPALTMQGLILGTAAYMAPEQAKGKPVDKRADIWAFGCVLFEMLTGQRAFAGEDVTDTIVAVMSREPAWSALPSEVPAHVRALLARCLTKDPRDRLRDIGEARIALQHPLGAPVEQKHAARPSWPLAVAAAAVVALVSGAVGWFSARRSASPPPPAPVLRAVIDPQPAAAVARLTLHAFAFTPDGREIVFAGNADDGVRALYRRNLAESTAVRIVGTDGAALPFLSPDGRSVAFFAGGALKRVPLEGGAVVTIHDLRTSSSEALAVGWGNELGNVGGLPFGATWLIDDTIVYGRFTGGLWQISANGGTPKSLTTIDDGAGELAHRLPSALSNRRAVVFTALGAGLLADRTSIHLWDFDTGRRHQLVADAADGRYAPTGHLVFARRGALFAQRFDPASLALTGDAVRVVPDVMHAVGGNVPGLASGAAQYAISATGTLAFLRGGVLSEARRTIGWLRPGQPLRAIDVEPRAYLNPRLSPDGQMIAVGGIGANENVNGLFLVDPHRAIATLVMRGAPFAVWTADSRHLIAAVRRDGDTGQHLYRVPVDTGEPQLLLKSASLLWPSSVSRDGRWLAYVESNPTTGNDVWVLGLNPSDSPRAIVKTDANESFPTFSPDGRVLAYTSTQSGQPEAYVQRFPDGGRPVQVTRGGARALTWSRDGKSLLYLVGRSQLMAVTIERDISLRVGDTRKIADGRIGSTTPVGSIDMAEDGSFLVTFDVDAPSAAPPLPQLQLLVNALSGLHTR